MPTPFITQQDLTDVLGRSVTADNGAVIALDAACEIVRTVAEQTFNRVTGDQIALDGSGTDALLLPQLPASNIGQVLVDGTAVSDYVLGDNGVLFRRGALPDAGALVWPTGRQNVQVTYDHGYTEVPRDVRMVALAVAQRLVVQGPFIEESLGDARGKYAVASTDLTNGEKAILRKYRRAS